MNRIFTKLFASSVITLAVLVGATIGFGQTGEIIYPKSSFDKNATVAALAEGNGKITGVACSYAKDGGFLAVGERVLASNMVISLFPATPYIEEWQKLRKKEGKKKSVYMSQEAVKHRIDVITDADGRFTFDKMKPGKYYLMGISQYSLTYEGSSYSGRSDIVDGTIVHYYEPWSKTVAHTDLLEKFVEVKTDGENVQTTLKKGWSGLLRPGCSKA